MIGNRADFGPHRPFFSISLCLRVAKLQVRLIEVRPERRRIDLNETRPILCLPLFWFYRCIRFKNLNEGRDGNGISFVWTCLRNALFWFRRRPIFYCIDSLVFKIWHEVETNKIQFNIYLLNIFWLCVRFWVYLHSDFIDASVLQIWIELRISGISFVWTCLCDYSEDKTNFDSIFYCIVDRFINFQNLTRSRGKWNSISYVYTQYRFETRRKLLRGGR